MTRLAVLAFAFLTSSVQAAPLKSFLPDHGLAAYAVQKLDTHTFSSSLNPRRTSPAQTYFADFGLRPSRIAEEEVEFDATDWRYDLRILKRGDLNGDGIEDVLVCFSDSAKQGSYHATHSLLLTQYSATTPLVAIALNISDPSCRA